MSEKAVGKRPNVIFILADDMGWGDLGCHGNEDLKTPNLDRLAAEGTLFTQFYVNAPVCSPSRTGFMSGTYPNRLRIHHIVMPPEKGREYGVPTHVDPGAPMVTRQLQKAGYRTGHFGKWHLSTSSPEVPDPGQYGIDDHRTFVSSGPSWPQFQGGKLTPEFCMKSSELIFDEAIRFVEEKRDEPFYCNVWTLVPHAPLNPSDEHLEYYSHLRPNAGVPHLAARQIYYAAVTDMDFHIGRLLDRLEDLGLRENTIVIFSSDNGPEDMVIQNAGYGAAGTTGPFRGRKRSLYEGGLRMPFIVRWPERVAAGRVDTRSVTAAVDYLPTICSICGADLPEGKSLDGEDVSDIWLGETRSRRRDIMWEWRFTVFGHVVHRSPRLAIRSGNWKLVLNPQKDRVELYDIPNDPTELSNLAKDNPEVVERLSAKVIEWHKTLPPGPTADVCGSNFYPMPQENPGRKPV
ncbi:sulfatase-like hydrolase/transferase [bacterium]|nr:sulfatase-like hydrolase/transferase [bacterium]